MVWDWRHLVYIQNELEKVTRRETKKAIICIPPRHGKSEQVTVRYSVYRLEQEPTMRVAIGAYSQDLANLFSRRARKIARERMALNEERRAVEEWETIAGGGFKAVGVGSGITGRGANLIILDDPIKGREEAESLTYREKVWEWYRNDIYTRLEPDGQIILIITRWHQDDLAGRILNSEDGKNWTVISLPAEAEENDPLGREIGEALCPERYDLAALAERRTVLGSYGYNALYQQRPVPREGNMFKRAWFEVVEAVPAHARRVRWWDKAATAGAGDYTVGALVAYADGIWYIEDIVRGQWSSYDRDSVILQTAALDSQKYPQGVHIWSEQEPGSSGKDVAQEFIKMLAGYAVSTEPTTGNKELMADPFASQCEARNVKIVSGDWNAAFLDEIIAFPSAAHDDQVDACCRAFLKLTEGGVWRRTRRAA